MPMSSYNFYCDESTHLQHDGHPYLVLGAVWCPTALVPEIAVRVREIKAKHNINPKAELKWVRISPSTESLYMDLVDYFFDDDDLHFRSVVAPKVGLDHKAYGQTHDTWYYKMYFQLLQRIIVPAVRNFIYLDIKDSKSAQKVARLRDILANNEWDFERNVVARLQSIRSHESELMQLTDVLIGAVNYTNRGLSRSKAKLTIAERVKQRSGYDLDRSTLPSERKFNVFHWRPRSR